MKYEENPRTYLTLSMVSAALFVFTLAVAVFGWGLHSKLSLYRLPVRASATSPIAKLLSERERPADRAQALEIAPANLAVPVIMAAAIVLAKPRQSIQRAPVDVSPVASRMLALRGPTLRRPPPTYFA